jgi:soluble P-type ATPase
MAGDLIEVVLVGLGANDVDYLVERHLGVALRVG